MALTAARTTSMTEMMVVAWLTPGPRDHAAEVAWKVSTATRPLVVTTTLKTLEQQSPRTADREPHAE